VHRHPHAPLGNRLDNGMKRRWSWFHGISFDLGIKPTQAGASTGPVQSGNPKDELNV